MLSIAIPIYNTDVSALYTELIKQAEKENISFEILLYDDDSKDEFKLIHRQLPSHPSLIYKELEFNIGRSAIRNLLAKEARGEYILFLDADSKIVSDEFIKNYLREIPATVVVGGTKYLNSIKECISETENESDYKLHWEYGRNVESKSSVERKMHSWKNFHSNNFFIRKVIFEQICFNEKLREYGHEDTLFGIELKWAKIKVRHIDNPVVHTGLETNYVFLKKTRKALNNLLWLYKSHPGLNKEIKALKYLKRAHKSGIHFFIAKRFRKKRKEWEVQLTGNSPSLRTFKLYKLGYLCDGLRDI